MLYGDVKPADVGVVGASYSSLPERVCNNGGGIGSEKSSFLAPVEGENGPLAAMTVVLCCVELLLAVELVKVWSRTRWILHCYPSAADKEETDARVFGEFSPIPLRNFCSSACTESWGEC